MKFLPITSNETLKLCKNPPNFSGVTIFICSYPKSGTTWTQNIVYQILKGVPSTLEDDVDHISLCSPFYENDATWENGKILDVYTNIHKKLGFRVFNTHLKWDMLPKGSSYKYIYIYRDGKDVVCSFFHHLTNQVGDGEYSGTFKQFLSSWLQGDLPYGEWMDHLKSWSYSNIIDVNAQIDTFDMNESQTQSTPNILYLKYENLVTNIKQEVPRLHKFLHQSNSSHQDCILDHVYETISFDSMKQNIAKYQPRSVKWRQGFSFIRQGRINSYSELFDDEDLLTYASVISDDFVAEFEKNDIP